MKKRDAIVVGDCWHGGKAARMDELIRDAGQTRSKVSVPRIAARAGVDPDFVRSLRIAEREPGTPECDEGFTDRDDESVLAVLDMLGVSLDDFEQSAGSMEPVGT